MRMHTLMLTMQLIGKNIAPVGRPSDARSHKKKSLHLPGTGMRTLMLTTSTGRNVALKGRPSDARSL